MAKKKLTENQLDLRIALTLALFFCFAVSKLTILAIIFLFAALYYGRQWKSLKDKQRRR